MDHSTLMRVLYGQGDVAQQLGRATRHERTGRKTGCQIFAFDQWHGEVTLALDAPYVQLKGGAMLSGELDAQFPLWGAAKDARLIQEAGRAAGVDLAVVEAARRHFERALADGHGDLDMAATYLSH